MKLEEFRNQNKHLVSHLYLEHRPKLEIPSSTTFLEAVNLVNDHDYNYDYVYKRVPFYTIELEPHHHHSYQIGGREGNIISNIIVKGDDVRDVRLGFCDQPFKKWRLKVRSVMFMIRIGQHYQHHTPMNWHGVEMEFPK
jgi:hypothetical protein